MTGGSLALIHQLVETEAFVEAFAELIDEEKTLLLADLRNAVRSGDDRRAALLEGELGLLDDLPGRLNQYARKYSPNRP